MTSEEQACLNWAMNAKDKIFKAQDAAEEIMSEETRRKIRKLLASARQALEGVDRALRLGGR